MLLRLFVGGLRFAAAVVCCKQMQLLFFRSEFFMILL